MAHIRVVTTRAPGLIPSLIKEIDHASKHTRYSNPKKSPTQGFFKGYHTIFFMKHT